MPEPDYTFPTWVLPKQSDPTNWIMSAMQMGADNARQKQQFGLQMMKLKMQEKQDQARVAGELLNNHLTELEINDAHEMHKGMTALKLGQDYDPTFYTGPAISNWEKAKAGNALQRTQDQVDTGFSNRLNDVMKVIPEAGLHVRALVNPKSPPNTPFWTPERVEALNYFSDIADQKTYDATKRKAEITLDERYRQALDTANIRAQSAIEAANIRASVAGDMATMKAQIQADRDQVKNQAAEDKEDRSHRYNLYRDAKKEISKRPESIEDRTAAERAKREGRPPPMTAKEKALNDLNSDSRFREFSGYQEPTSREDYEQFKRELSNIHNNPNLTNPEKTGAIGGLMDRVNKFANQLGRVPGFGYGPTNAPKGTASAPKTGGKKVRILRLTDGKVFDYSGDPKDLEDDPDYQLLE